MKVITLFPVLFLGVLGIALAQNYEEKKEQIKAFYKCIACSEGDTIREEYLKCAECKPKKVAEAAEECQVLKMPEATDSATRWAHLCSNIDLVDEILACMSEKVTKSELTEEEIAQAKEYKECVEKLNTESCK